MHSCFSSIFLVLGSLSIFWGFSFIALHFFAFFCIFSITVIFPFLYYSVALYFPFFLFLAIFMHLFVFLEALVFAFFCVFSIFLFCIFNILRTLAFQGPWAHMKSAVSHLGGWGGEGIILIYSLCRTTLFYSINT